MMNSPLSPYTAIVIFLLFLANFPSDASADQKSSTFILSSFLQCLSNSSIPPDLIFNPTNENYTAIFFSAINNRRTLANSPRPFVIVTPTQESHIQSSVLCSKNLNVSLRIRSGGHDYEGLSYASKVTPFFIIVDLQMLRSVVVDSSVTTAWVQAGASLGELYYAVAMKSKVAAFPAGACPAVGVGGHFSGGGFGTIMRAHGLSIDNIVDARIVNANGDVLDRESMGEDLFWALRGGGGASFGVISSYKIKLVQVPPKVTVFSITKTQLTENTAKLVAKFQEIAHTMDNRIFIYAVLQPIKEENEDKKVQVTFTSLFLGQKDELFPLMEKSFPELELKEEEDCTEITWIESILYIAGYPTSSPLTVLLDRTPWSNSTSSFKNKSDFLTAPITEEVWNQIFKWLLEDDQWPVIIIEPLGGKMGEISETETPFPHRKGSLYDLQYILEWEDEGIEETEKNLAWMRRFYEFMAPYVSRNPRGAYLNYRDLDLGVNEEGNASYMRAREWGERYFKRNFRKLAKVKGEVDPQNLFRNEQSIPALF